MTRARPIAVGPYEFSLHDARRTLAEANEILAGFPDSCRAEQSERVAAIARVVGDASTVALDVTVAQLLLDEVWPLLMSARADRVRSGDLPASVAGRVVQLNSSGGGVPKLPVERVVVGFGGVEGDVQATRRHHGKPNQALCLWNVETIEALRADGHPITYGSAGENVTVAGVPWSDVTPGVRLQIGDVLCEVSSYAIPCTQNARWFSDREFRRIHHQRGPNSRVYATVLEPGAITTGDDVVLEPPTTTT